MASEVELERMIVRLMGDSSNYVRMLEEAQQATIKAAGSIQGTFAAIGGVVGTQLVSGLSDATSKFTSFELAMSRSVGLANVAQSEVAGISREVMALAGATGRGPDELARALFFISSAGFEGEKAMKVLEIAAKGAMAGMGDAKTVAFSLTSALNSYQKSGLEAATAMDVLVAGVRAGKMEIEALAPVIGRIAPLASAMGVSFQDLVATIAILTKTGSSPAEAVTQLQAMFINLQSPSRDAKAAIQEAGLSMDQLKNMLKSPEGLIQVLQLLNKSMGDNEKGMSAVMPGFRAIRGSMNILAQDPDKITGVFKEIRGSMGSLETAFGVASATIAVKWEKLTSSLTGAKVDIGGTLGPAVISLIDKIQELIDWWSSLDDTTKRVIVSVVSMVATLTTLAVILPIATTAVGFLAGSLRDLAITALAQGPYLGYVAMIAVSVAIWREAIFYVTDYRKHLADLNDELDRASKLQASLLSTMSKRASAVMEKGNKLPQDEQKGFFTDELGKANQQVEQLNGRITSLKAKMKAEQGDHPGLTRLATAFGTLGMSEVLPYIIDTTSVDKANKNELKETEQVLEAARKKAEELREALGKIDQADAAKKTIPNIKELVKEIQTAIDTFGMNKFDAAIHEMRTKRGATQDQIILLQNLSEEYKEVERAQKASDAAESYIERLDVQRRAVGDTARETQFLELAMMGVSDVELRAIARMSQQIDAQERHNKLIQAGQKTIKDSLEPWEKFEERVIELKKELAAGAITQEQYEKAVDKARKAVEKHHNEHSKFNAVLAGSHEAQRLYQNQLDTMYGRRQGPATGPYTSPLLPERIPDYTIPGKPEDLNKLQVELQRAEAMYKVTAIAATKAYRDMLTAPKAQLDEFTKAFDEAVERMKKFEAELNEVRKNIELEKRATQDLKDQEEFRKKNPPMGMPIIPKAPVIQPPPGFPVPVNPPILDPGLARKDEERRKAMEATGGTKADDPVKLLVDIRDLLQKIVDQPTVEFKDSALT